MSFYQWFVILFMVVLYGLLFLHSFRQKKSGTILYTAAAAVELTFVILGKSLLRYSLKTPGCILVIAGFSIVLIAFISDCVISKDNSEANGKEFLHRTAVYKISRYPAELGFTLFSVGVLCIFFNIIFAIVLLCIFICIHIRNVKRDRKLVQEYGEEYTSYKKRVCRYLGIKSWKYYVPVCVIVLGAFVAYALYGSSQMKKIPSLSLMDTIEYTTGGNDDAVITVGYIKDGKRNIKVYGKDGALLTDEKYRYEIGSLTKTFTGALIAQAEKEGKLSIDETIDKYIDWFSGDIDCYPTIRSILTHTSGYKSWYETKAVVLSTMLDRNPYYGIKEFSVLNNANDITAVPDAEFKYSNFGYAILGQVLESVYNDTYYNLVRKFVIQNNLGNINFAAFEDGNTSLGNRWDWELNDAYVSAGALTSDIDDCLSYAELQLKAEPDSAIGHTHDLLKRVDASTEAYKMMGINMDSVGLAWMIDEENNFYWHNGGTGDYNCYMGFDIESQTAVVILSNLPPDYRIPATVMGVKLLKEIQ